MMKNTYNKSFLFKKYSSKKGQPANQRIAFTKSFTDPLLTEQLSDEYNVTSAPDGWQEYDLSVVAEEDIVAQKSWGNFERSNSMEAAYFVESFEEKYTIEPTGRSQENHQNNHASGIQNDNQTAPNQNSNKYAEPAFREPRIPLTNQAPPAYNAVTKPDHNVISNSHPVVAQSTSSNKEEDEDDFINDLKDILSGQKTYSETQKKVTPRNEDRSHESPAPANPAENRHAIFEQLSQSMKYANAYDLGDIDIEQRFQDFDHLSEAKEKKTELARPVPLVSPAHIQTSTTKSHVSNEDFILDLDDIIRAPSSYQMQDTLVEIPLDPGEGGRSIAGTALEAGDIIVSTTRATVSSAIRTATNSPVSHASIYLGNNTVAEIMGSGIHIWSLEESLADDSLSVAYRHRDMIPAKAAQIELFVRQAKDNNTRYDYFSLLRVLPSALIENYCRRLPEASRQRCMAQAQRFRLGLDINNRFYCSELVLEALRQAGLSLSTAIPGWSTPNDIVELEHNGTLSYVGHLKTSL